MTDLDNDDINNAVASSHVIVPRVLTESEELVTEARMRVEYEDHPGEWLDLIERLANRVEELDKKLTETVMLYRKAQKSASDAGWELDARRQDYYQNHSWEGWH